MGLLCWPGHILQKIQDVVAGDGKGQDSKGQLDRQVNMRTLDV